MIGLWRKPRPERDLPHWFFLRLLADGLIFIGVVGTAVFVRAWAAGELPYVTNWTTAVTTAQILGPFVTVVLGWLLRGQVQQLHLTFNSKMDEYIRVVKAAAEAEGRLKEGRARDALAGAKAEGVIEGKASGPKEGN